MDSSVFKNSRDPLIRRRAAVPVLRCHLDITDLHLLGLPSLQADGTQAVLVGKHCCGGSLDLALHCLLHAARADSIKVSGALIASCCHHRCDWATYAGRDWLARWAVSEAEFAALCRTAAWGCNEDTEDEPRKAAGDGGAGDKVAKGEGDGMSGERVRRSAEERVAIGLEVKRFLDLGRVQAMRDAGFDADVTAFVPSTVTRENTALWVRRRPG